MRLLLASVVVVPLVTSCIESDLEIPKSDAPFAVAEPGKADGSGLLSAADQQRLESAFNSVVQQGQSTIAKLEQEIAKLESDHAKKQQEADLLVQQISAREQQLRDDYNRNLLICAFFPNPATCVLANYLANDGLITQYKRDLERARAAQQQIAADIAKYRAKRDTLRAKIDLIRSGRDRLLTMLRDNVTPTIPPELASSPEAGRAYWRADAMAKVKAAIGDEIVLLVDLRNAAVELSQTLDQSLATLRSLDQATAQLVEKSRKQFMKLVKALISGDPNAVAERWLEDEIAARTRQLLNGLSWPLNEFARFVVETDGSAHDVDQLVDRILRKLISDVQPTQPLVFTAATPVNILDRTTAKSPLDITQNRTVSSLEVFVDIEHTYVGDLVITLEKGSAKYTLANHAGGGQQNLAKTFSVPVPAGTSLNGRWTLVVADTEDRDTGKLKRWQLIAR